MSLVTRAYIMCSKEMQAKIEHRSTAPISNDSINFSDSLHGFAERF